MFSLLLNHVSHFTLRAALCGTMSLSQVPLGKIEEASCSVKIILILIQHTSNKVPLCIYFKVFTDINRLVRVVCFWFFTFLTIIMAFTYRTSLNQRRATHVIYLLKCQLNLLFAFMVCKAQGKMNE